MVKKKTFLGALFQTYKRKYGFLGSGLLAVPVYAQSLEEDNLFRCSYNKNLSHIQYDAYEDRY
jgi:hypothetical protein